MLGERHKTSFLFLIHVKVDFKLENSRGRKIEDKEKNKEGKPKKNKLLVS